MYRSERGRHVHGGGRKLEGDWGPRQAVARGGRPCGDGAWIAMYSNVTLCMFYVAICHHAGGDGGEKEGRGNISAVKRWRRGVLPLSFFLI